MKRDYNLMMAEETSGSVIPYMCVFIDASLKELSSAALECVKTNHDRKKLIEELQNMWTVPANPNPVLPLLSVRTGFDMFLKVMNFPPGSEIIMSAMNIPDMVCIVRHHKLNIVPLDISIETTAAKVELLPQLVSPRTVAIVIAHLYGKWSPMEEVIAFAKERNLYVVEDCAECFCGFEKLSHPESDLAFFSFGAIKFYTSFGGAIAKVKPELYKKMVALHETYRIQSQAGYLKKILKYTAAWLVLNSTTINKSMIQLMLILGYPDYKDRAVSLLLRGFPDHMLQRIREKPSGALLATMVKRLKSFSAVNFYLQHLKGEYVASRLPPNLEVVGYKAAVNNYWLFPIIAENPDNLMHLLNTLGVDAYRGATQLNIVEPHNGNPHPFLPDPHHAQTHRDTLTGSHMHQSPDTSSMTASFSDGHVSTMYSQNKQESSETSDVTVSASEDHVPTVNIQYPHEAKYLVDHVLYLPVNKLVPFHMLNRMLRVIRIAVALDKSQGDEKVRMVLPSKL